MAILVRQMQLKEELKCLERSFNLMIYKVKQLENQLIIKNQIITNNEF
jgi:hypothetical protein